MDNCFADWDIWNLSDSKTLCSKEKIEIKEPSIAEVKKRYDEKGRLKSDATIVHGVRQGVAHNYYDDGTIHSEIYYVNDSKHGNSIWYYPNGKPYRITPFVMGKKEGRQQVYYQSGTLMAEIPYHNDTLIPGTKEYHSNGSLIKSRPQYTITASLANKNAEIYRITIRGKHLERIAYVQLNGSGNIRPNLEKEKGGRYFHYKKTKPNDNKCHFWLATKSDLNNLVVSEVEVGLPK